MCEPGSAFFPTLEPANERLRSSLTPPPPAQGRRPRRLSVTRRLPAHHPAGDKGELGTPPGPPLASPGPGGKIAPLPAPLPRSEQRARRGLSGLAPARTRGGGVWGRGHGGRAGNLKGKSKRGTGSGAPEE